MSQNPVVTIEMENGSVIKADDGSTGDGGKR